MTAQLVYREGTINGRPEKLVTLRSVRTAYRSSLPRCLSARGQNAHADPILWFEELGIKPVVPDGCTKRTCLIASEFHSVVDKRGWKADDAVQEETGCDDDEDAGYTAISVLCVLQQILNQKMDFIINALGGGFTLDESKLVNLN